MTFDVVVTGDSIVNREVSFCEDPQVSSLLNRVRDASVSLTHLETVCRGHSGGGDEAYPAAMSGGTWTRAPESVGEELTWAGFDVVSHASNHALDFSYGGLRATWNALDDADLPFAGTGANLADAREPAFVDIPAGRVGLVSMASSFPDWSRAGDARPDVQGRPGVNPLRYHYAVDDESFETLREMGRTLGLVVRETDEELTLMRPESRNATTRFERSGDGRVHRVLDARDREENLRTIESAATSAEVVVAHVHSHEFRLGGDVSEPPRALEAFARECVDHGADIVVNQGSHAPTRGIEIYDGTPVFYDPGEFFLTSATVTRQPSDFYYGYEDVLDEHPQAATPAEGMAARGFDLPWEGAGFAEEDSMKNPEGGFFVGPGSVLARCQFDDAGTVTAVVLHPVTWRSEPKSLTGLPVEAEGELAAEILEYVAEQSAQYGTTLERAGSTAEIEL